MSRFPPFVLVVICATLVSHNAAAQSPATNWTGFYIGINGGAGSSDGFDLGDASESFATNGFKGNVPFGSTHGDSSFLAGGQIGYNQQFGKAVVGVEWDINWLSFEGSVAGFEQFFNNPLVDDYALLHVDRSAKLDLASTLRARAGLSWRSFLFYATGGLALGDLTVQANDSSTVFTLLGGHFQQAGSGSDSGIAFGWAAGGGLEWSINRTISIAAEYQHLDIGGSYNPTSNSQLFNAKGDVDFADNQVVLRMNVHLSAFFTR